jgi:hypothetical protein
VLHLFGNAILKSLERIMGTYLKSTGGFVRISMGTMVHDIVLVKIERLEIEDKKLLDDT